jgi:hypothetical protein
MDIADEFVQVRFSYADVLFLLPFAIALMMLPKRPLMLLPLALMVLALVLGGGYWSWMNFSQCERSRPCLFLLGLSAAMAIIFIQKAAENSGEPLGTDPAQTLAAAGT